MDAMDIFAPAGIRLIPVVHEQGAGHMADGYARVSGRHGVVIGQNGPGISNCVTAIAAALLGAQPGRDRHARGRHDGHRPRRLPGSQPAADVPGVHQVPGPREQPDAHGRVHRRAASTARCREMGPTQLNIPRDYFYGEIETRDPAADARSTAAPAATRASTRRPSCSRNAKFPVIISRRRRGDGRRASRNARRSPNGSARRSSTATCTTTRSPPATRCGAARWATRARRRR